VKEEVGRAKALRSSPVFFCTRGIKKLRRRNPLAQFFMQSFPSPKERKNYLRRDLLKAASALFFFAVFSTHLPSLLVQAFGVVEAQAEREMTASTESAIAKRFMIVFLLFF
jgi:hypothetical protein